jgi:hypothetical protein
MEIIDIFRGIGRTRNMNFDIEDEPTKYTLAMIFKNRDLKYANCSENGDENFMEVANKSYGVLPHIPLWLERFIVLISGASGEGKTLMVSVFIRQMVQFFPDFKIYYVCPTNIKKDKSLASLSKYITQIFPHEIHFKLDKKKKDDDEIEDTHTVEKMENSLVIFDDIEHGDGEKQANKLLNNLLVKGRKYAISLIWISHSDTHAKFSTFDKEINLYITRPSNLKDNRLIEKYLKLDIKPALPYITMKDSFVCINKTFGYCITDNTIISVNSTSKESDE